MKKLGELLKEGRQSKGLSKQEVARQLLIKEKVISALEEGDWAALPEPAFVAGFIKKYAQLLELDIKRLLALHRAEYDEKKYPPKTPITTPGKTFFPAPKKLAPLLTLAAAFAFVAYLLVQTTSILNAPRLVIFAPQDDTTTTAAVIEVSGQTQSDAAVSINGEIVAPDASGNFSYQLKLQEGVNIIEIIVSRRLSPKTKAKRIIRLSR